ncbi:acyltransferase family protein [Silvibacterium sp.]|uniref:acyltransferase family protein n=1 Tax=Silvibacterium sp. TaxID=1964179 RepID=UPI0039E35B2A
MATVTASAAKPPRIVSIDALRGLTIAFMILVNNNGDESHAYWPLKHAAWNGFTPTDLVFPTFLFLVGVSTVFSTQARLAQGASRVSLFFHALKRAIILFAFGQVVNNFPFFHLATWRVYGVLPRIAICYFIISVFYLLSTGWRSKLITAVGCLVGYWILMRFVPIPGYGVPTHAMPINDPNLNLVAWLDRHIFSAPHLYERVRDPEGFLSTLPAVGTALMGVLTGIWLRTHRSMADKAKYIGYASVACVVLGLLWNPFFPINKKLWTSSYVLFAGGLSLALLTISMLVVELRRGKDDAANRKPGWLMPFLVFGSNSIFAYVLSELLAGAIYNLPLRPGVTITAIPYRAVLNAIGNPAFVSLLYSLAFVLVCWIPTYILYRRRIFLKI